MGYTGEAKYLDVKRLAGGQHRFEVSPCVASESQLKLVAGDRCLDRILMTVQLIPNGSPNEVGSVRVKAFLHKEIDLTQVNTAQIDRDFLTVGSLRSKLAYIVDHHSAIPTPSLWMVDRE